MATIIDSLVIELGLDTKNFSELQKKAIEDLKRLEDAGVRHGQNVERHVATGLAGLVRFIENPIASARRHLETLAQPAQRSAIQLQNLGAQGRRSGTDVEAGALAGAAGLRVLGGAGLLAWASLTAVNKVMSAVHDNVGKTFSAGVGAAGAGLPIQRYTAIAQALFKSGNVSKEQTEGWLTDFGQRQAYWQKFGGTPPTVSSSLFATGSNINTPIQDILRNFARYAQRFGNSPDDERTVISRGADLNITPAMSRALKQLGPGGFDRGVNEAERTALTLRDAKTADEFLKQFNDLNTELGRFITNWVNAVAPQLGQIAAAFSAFLKWLNVEGFDKGKGGSGALTPEQREQRWREKPFQRWWRRQTQGPEGTATIPPRGGATNSNIPFGTGNRHVRDPRGLAPYIREGAAARGINPDMAVAVANSEGLGTFLGDGGKSGGAFQLYTGGGLGNTFQRDTGLDPLDQKNEKATIDYALDHIARNGWGPWHGARRIGITGKMGIGGKSTEKPTVPAGTVKFDDMQITPSVPDPAGDVGGNGKPYHRRFAALGDLTGAIRYGDVQPPHRTLQASFGDITIHTAATTPHGIADEFRERVRQGIAVANLNTGFV